VLANTWAWPITGAPHITVASHLMGGPVGRLLIRQFNLFVNAMIPAGHQLRKPTADEMAHYREALASADRRDASAVLPARITASRAFLADVEAGLPDLASLPTLIIWGDADIAFGGKERRRWEQDGPARPGVPARRQRDPLDRQPQLRPCPHDRDRRPRAPSHRQTTMDNDRCHCSDAVRPPALGGMETPPTSHAVTTPLPPEAVAKFRPLENCPRVLDGRRHEGRPGGRREVRPSDLTSGRAG
jgi:hypothetical protein